MKKWLVPSDNIVIGRNPRYLASVGLAFQSLFWTPESLWRAIAADIGKVILLLLGIVFSLMIWGPLRVLFFVLGMLGFCKVSDPDEEDEDEEGDCEV